MNELMARLVIACLGALCLSMSSCAYFPESSFTLAQESRLPKWFTIPSGLSRADVTVRMNNYIESSRRTATFTLLDMKGRTLAEVKGKLRGLEPMTLRNSRPGLPDRYPSYEIITANGITEIVEHRKMEPVFYVTDDPVIWAELGGR